MWMREIEYYNKFSDKINCGGFALNLDRWYFPYSDSNKRIEYIDNNSNLSIRDLYNRLLFKDTLFMLKEFKGKLFRIKSLKEVSDKDRVIAYRIGGMSYDPYLIDFHFRVRIDGSWYEKIGDDKVNKCNFTEDKWTVPTKDEEVNIIYDSDIIYFVLR